MEPDDVIVAALHPCGILRCFPKSVVRRDVISDPRKNSSCRRRLGTKVVGSFSPYIVVVYLSVGISFLGMQWDTYWIKEVAQAMLKKMLLVERLRLKDPFCSSRGKCKYLHDEMQTY